MAETENNNMGSDTTISENDQNPSKIDLALSTPAGKSITKLLADKKHQTALSQNTVEEETKTVLTEIEQSCQIDQDASQAENQPNNIESAEDTVDKTKQSISVEQDEDKPKSKTEIPTFGVPFSLSMLKAVWDKINLFFLKNVKSLSRISGNFDFKKIKLDKKTLLKNRTYYVVGILILFVLMEFCVHYSVRSSKEKANMILTKSTPVTLLDVKNTLDSFMNRTVTLSNNGMGNDEIIHQLNALSSALDNLNLRTQSAISYQKTISNQDQHDILQKLQQLTDAIESMRLTLQPVHYVDSQKLPFKVLSIDMIDGHSVASVSYNNTVIPLELGFHLAGWQLNKASYFEQTAEFIKARGDDISVKSENVPHIKIVLASGITNN